MTLALAAVAILAAAICLWAWPALEAEETKRRRNSEAAAFRATLRPCATHGLTEHIAETYMECFEETKAQRRELITEEDIATGRRAHKPPNAGRCPR